MYMYIALHNATNISEYVYLLASLFFRVSKSILSCFCCCISRLNCPAKRQGCYAHTRIARAFLHVWRLRCVRMSLENVV